MKIAILAPSRIPARTANSMQVMKMTQALANLGHEVRMAVPGPKPRIEDPELRWQELSYHYGLELRFPIDWLLAQDRWRRYDYGWRSVRWAGRWGAEVVYTRLPQAAAFSSWLGLRTIFELHDLPSGKAGPYLFRTFLNGKGAIRLVTISQVLREDLVEKIKEPGVARLSLVAPDGVDLNRYQELPEPLQARRALIRASLPEQTGRSFDPERFTVGYTGHLYPGRGISLILEMAARLPEVNFLLVGGEPEEVSHYQERIQKRGLQNVLLIGFVPNAELPKFQAACEVLLMPYQERVAASSGGDIARYLSPMKLFEYMACGRAILSSDLSVLREALTPENAMLLPPGDLEPWVAALEMLRANPDRRAALANQAQRDVEKFTWEVRAARILQGIEARTHEANWI
jgi:glycosyltransferase involved in cell wall biosynthesis